LSHFGDLVKKLRKEKGLTLEAVAKKIGSHKGYVSGIENDKVNPPSVKIIKKYAKLLGQDARALARLGWVDKAPEILKEDAEKFLRWCQANEKPADHFGGTSTSPALPPQPPQA
jgi:transcriptional regulator with XRE-family HTH domain